MIQSIVRRTCNVCGDTEEFAQGDEVKSGMFELTVRSSARFRADEDSGVVFGNARVLCLHVCPDCMTDQPAFCGLRLPVKKPRAGELWWVKRRLGRPPAILPSDDCRPWVMRLVRLLTRTHDPIANCDRYRGLDLGDVRDPSQEQEECTIGVGHFLVPAVDPAAEADKYFGADPEEVLS